jgi:Ribonuclease G/E
MKNITSFLNDKNQLFKKFEEIETKVLGSRKKILIYDACDIKNNLISVFVLESKTRFLVKNAKEIEILNEKLKHYKDHNFKKTFILISSPLCSKAKKYMVDLKWKIYDDFS